jgi:hypothetical protein
MSILYRGSSKDASYQVSVHLAKRFQKKRFFRNQPIRNNNCLWRPCLVSKKSSLLKLLGQMSRKLVGSIYGTSSINSAHFVSLPIFDHMNCSLFDEFTN